jgi:hypothetical protein
MRIHPDRPALKFLMHRLCLRNLSGSGSTFTLNKHTTVNGLVNIAAVSADTFRFTVNGTINEGGLYTGSSYGPIISGLLDRVVNNTGVMQYRLNSPIAQHFSTNIELSVIIGFRTHRRCGARHDNASPSGISHRLQFREELLSDGTARIDSLLPTFIWSIRRPGAHGIPDADSLHVLQWKGNAWHEVPVLGKDLTFARNIVAGPVDTLTTFVIAGPQRKGTAVLSTHALSYGTVKTGTDKLIP